ncbi:MAG TPA: D-alanyl-D-alanine carboxypeptidase, partial [Gammaproteobacteria bacterium]
MRKAVVTLLCIALLSPVVTWAKLPDPLLEILREKNIPTGSLTVLVQGLDDPKPLLAHNIEKPMNPASVMKLVTTYVALQMLGPDYRWKTEFYLDGRFRKGTLFG